MTRRTKTPAQRAQEALAAATRRLTRATAKVRDLDTDLAAAKAEQAAAERRHAFLAQDPDLPAAKPERTPKP